MERNDALKLIQNVRLDRDDNIPLPSRSILITEENEPMIRRVINCGKMKIGVEYVITFDDNACNYPYSAYEKEDLVKKINDVMNK